MPHLKHGAQTEHSIPRDISATLFHWSRLCAWIWKAWACFSPTAAMSQFASVQLKRPGIIVTQPVVKLALVSSSVKLIFFHWDTELSDFPGSISPSFSTHPLSWSWSCHPVCHELCFPSLAFLWLASSHNCVISTFSLPCGPLLSTIVSYLNCWICTDTCFLKQLWGFSAPFYGSVSTEQQISCRCHSLLLPAVTPSLQVLVISMKFIYLLVLVYYCYF